MSTVAADVAEGTGAGTGGAAAPGPPVGWLELFYDLVFVASVIVFSNALSHDLTWPTAAWMGGAFVLVWWTWMSTTALFNRFRSDDWAQRGLVLVLMFLVTLITAVAGNGTDEHRDGVSGLFGGALVVVALMYRHAGHVRPELETYARRRSVPFAVAGIVFLASAPFERWVEAGFWVAGAAVLVYPVVRWSFRDVDDEPPLDHHHFVERVGLFTIIVLGEAFVKVALTAADGDLVELDLEVLAMQFIIVFSVWSAYFDDIPHAGLPGRVWRQRIWALAHLPLHLAIVATAVGAGKLLTLEVGIPVPLGYATASALPLALGFVALAVIGIVAPRRPWAPLFVLRILTAVALMATNLITQISFVDVEEDAALLATICAVHAVIALALRRRTVAQPV